MMSEKKAAVSSSNRILSQLNQSLEKIGNKADEYVWRMALQSPLDIEIYLLRSAFEQAKDNVEKLRTFETMLPEQKRIYSEAEARVKVVIATKHNASSGKR
ncbi:hypothetical protein [Franconibacter daqui]|uniref:Uncharacterized protein n=1 Tax=Franconibacter daqui TaxID=2047724 RepID=A0ABV1PJX6_9ENTR